MNYSRQRESIKEFLASRKDHPTADTVYLNIRQQYPNISLGTVYRNLGLLSEIGEIQKLTTGDGCDRFDYRTDPHNHFICRRCHCVSDLDMDSIEDIMTIAQKNFHGKIERHHTNFYGVCENCLKAETETASDIQGNS